MFHKIIMAKMSKNLLKTCVCYALMQSYRETVISQSLQINLPRVYKICKKDNGKLQMIKSTKKLVHNETEGEKPICFAMRRNDEKLSLQIQQKDFKAIEACYTDHTQQSDINQQESSFFRRGG